MQFKQRLADCLGDQPADLRLAMKSDLALGRMDIHIHGGRINFQKQAANGIAPFHQGSVVSLEQREIQPAILDRPAVNEQMLVRTRRARYTRL